MSDFKKIELQVTVNKYDDRRRKKARVDELDNYTYRATYIISMLIEGTYGLHFNHVGSVDMAGKPTRISAKEYIINEGCKVALEASQVIPNCTVVRHDVIVLEGKVRSLSQEIPRLESRIKSLSV